MNDNAKRMFPFRCALSELLSWERVVGRRSQLTSGADPEGDFVEAIGRNFTADQAAKVISDHIKDWEGPLKKKDRWA